MTSVPSTVTDPLEALSRRKGMNWRTFVVPAARVMYVQINKNACTSLKWMIAGIAGEDLKGFRPSLEATTSDQDDIHDRRQWKKTPRLSELDPQVRRQIRPDDGWFVFAVLRDPRSRLFSAWQSKLLLENPGYANFRGEPWYPRHPLTAETVVRDFEAFVDLFERRPEMGLRRDGHFRDQVEMLHDDLVTYSGIYDIRELGRLQTDLRQHLDEVGWQGELNLPRLNDTPLRPNAVPFGGGVRERVEKLYAADFERFGERWDFATIEKAAEWTEHDLETAEERAMFGRRMGYLRSEVLKLRDEATAERKRADAAQARAEKLQKELAARGTPTVRADLVRYARAARRRLRRR